MRYFGLSFQFIVRNFLYLAVFCAVPSFILAYYYRDSSLFIFFKSLFSDTPVNSYFFFSFISNETWYFGVGILLLIGVTFSFAFAYINRVLKIGSRSIGKSFKKTSESLVPVFLVLFVLIIVVQAFAFLAWGIVALMLLSNDVLMYRVLIPISLTVLYSGMLFLIFKLFMAIPTMLTLGYKFRESMGYSIKLSAGKIFKFALATFIIFLIILGLSSFSNILYDALWFRLIISTICYMLFFTYFPALTMIAFYDINGMNRLDVKRKFIYS